MKKLYLKDTTFAVLESATQTSKSSPCQVIKKYSIGNATIQKLLLSLIADLSNS